MKRIKDNADIHLLLASLLLMSVSYYVLVNYRKDKAALIISFIALAVFSALSVLLLARVVKRRKLGKKLSSFIGGAFSALAVFVAKIASKLRDGFSAKNGNRIYVKGRDSVRIAFSGRENRKTVLTREKPPKRKNIKTPSDKVRYTYIIYVGRKPEIPSPSDTARQILGADKCDNDALLLSVYEPVRYGNIAPDEKTAEKIYSLV